MYSSDLKAKNTLISTNFIYNKTYFETANNTLASCSHLFNASTLLVLRCGRDSMNILSDHSKPDVGHSCIAKKKKLTHLGLYQLC